MATVAASAGLALPVLLALLIGPGAFGVVVVAVAALVFVDLSGLLARAGARPVVLVAALPALVLPLAVALVGHDAWEWLPLIFSVTVLAAFALVLVFGRRRHVVEGLGATLFLAVLVGVGATTLLLLRALPGGFRWVLGFGLLAAAADLGPALVEVLAQRGTANRPGQGGEVPWQLPGTLMLVAVVAGVLVLLLEPPFTPVSVLLFALVAVSSALGGDQVRGALAMAAGAPVDPAEGVRVGEGVLLGVADVVLFGAPAAYVLARAAAG